MKLVDVTEGICKMVKIYTKTGDKGETGLVSGARISKGHDLIDLYGEVDELNANLGFLLSFLSDDNQSDVELLKLIQNALFDLGSNLACEAQNRVKYKLPQINQDAVLAIESRIDEIDQELTPLKNFILPGGLPASTYAHVCRTVCRRVERSLVRYGKDLPQYSVEFLNRLSDYLFVFSRYLNHLEKIEEVPWSLS